MEPKNRNEDQESAKAETVSLDEYRSKLKDWEVQLAERDAQINNLKDQILEWEEKIGGIRDYVKKMEAETAAIKERSKKDIEFQVQQRQAEFLKIFLGILDNLERSLRAGVTEDNWKSFVEGIELIQKQMMDGLREVGVERIPTLGEKFEPHLHEAMATQEVNEDQDDLIVEELLPGYRLRDFVIRPSKVVVGKKRV